MAELAEHQAVLYELLQEVDRICRLHQIPYTLFAGTALGAVRHKDFVPWDDDLDIAMLRSDYERFLEVAPRELDSRYYLQAEFSEHWPLHFSKLRKNNTTCLEKYHPKDPEIHQGIYVDLFPIDNASDRPFVRKLQYCASRVVLAKTLQSRGYVTDSVKKKLAMGLCRLLPLKPFHRLTMLRGAGASQTVHSFLGGTSSYAKGLYRREWMSETARMEFHGRQFPVSAHYDALLTTLYGDYMTPPPEDQRRVKEHSLLVDTERNYTEYEHYRDGMEFEVLTRSIR